MKRLHNNMQLHNNEFYVKGADGKDLATYEGQELQEWYVWGNDISGKLKGDKAYYYYKDHLGSVRVVVDNAGSIVAGYDYDAWGYPLENRKYNGDSIKYKYTGKELDKESFYDYFGARYYNSRIGRWGQVDPAMKKYLNLTPYNYSLNNPLITIDPDGEDPRRDQLGSINDVVNVLNKNLGSDYWTLSQQFDKENVRYVYTEAGGFLDLQHVFASAFVSNTLGFDKALAFGEYYESLQELGILNLESAWKPEDPPSNFYGALLGSKIKNPLSLNSDDVNAFIDFMKLLGIVDKNDPSIARDKLYIPENDKDIPVPERTGGDIYSSYRGEKSNYAIPLRYLKMFNSQGGFP